jgi:TetR/AcrR family transcriptional regulator, regulator of autoinduction and epiphytic fitness
MGTATNPSRDGRTVRAERTRQALVDALLELLYEGELQPTAERIAKRAGVSERSLFQHFADREVLYQAVAVQQFERIVPTLRPIDASRPLAERIEAFVDQRARLLETVTPVRRAALLLEPDSEIVSGWLAKTRRAKAGEVGRIFATEIERTSAKERPALVAALGAVSAWTFWEALRAHQGLTIERARDALTAALTALLVAER